VIKENLGRFPGRLAESALSLNYVLNVAVAISAGAGALVSAVPSLQAELDLPVLIQDQYADAEFPVYQNFTGNQLAASVLVKFSLSFMF